MLVSNVSDKHVSTYNYFSVPVALNIKSLASFLNQFDSTGNSSIYRAMMSFPLHL